jgi:multidrug resistance efflux pump
MNGKRRPRLFFWFLGLALLLGSAAGTGWVLNFSRAAAGSTADSGPSSTREVICLGFGDVEPGVTSLYPTQLGRVAEVFARENQVYKQGDFLLRMDKEKATHDLDKAKTALSLAQEELRQAQTLPKKERDAKLRQQKSVVEAAKQKLAAAEKERDYREEQYRNKNLNKLLFQAAEKNVRYLAAVLEAARAQQKELEEQDVMAKARRAEKEVALRKNDVQQAEYALKQCDLVAPVDGEVLRVLVSKGEVLGSQPKQPIIQFLPTAKDRIIRAEVEQEFADHVAVGKPALIEDDTRTGRRWQGKVIRLSNWYTHRRSLIQEPLHYNDVRTIECIVSLDPGQPPIRIGQRVRVIIGRDR